MTDNKLTDNVKTTDWLVKGISQEQLAKEQIQALKEEIKYLEAENEGLNKDYTRACTERDARIVTHKFIKAEAYKEFAENLKKKMVKHNFKYADTLFSANVATVPMVDNLLKELVGEDK